MFARLLIANRGEIACRIMRTCRRLGIATVAVYSDADANARHVREADIAARIGPAEARASYLNVDAIMAAAREHGADAIHPGYGFLSEKLALIDACAKAGIAFVGPHRDAIARMGSKIESKAIARLAGVPCVPGYDGEDQSVARLVDAARAIGFPLLIKASAGGGGKGMKRVDRGEDFVEQLAAARREALAAFADDRVLLERYVQAPRHLEVQLLGDRHGNLVQLFERECSIQRNYQKIVEEAPANHLGDAAREQLFASALALGRAIGYDSAGTVEFILDAARDDPPCFLEMNTRLQVEHPVTEITTGIDLVEWQLRVAAGEAIPFAQADVRRQGWAIEARVNAESPAAAYRASVGRIVAYDAPDDLWGVRIDSGIDAQSEITPHYDSLLAKVIGFGATREVAAQRLLAGVRGFRVAGVATNQRLLAEIVGSSAFDGVLTTRFLGERFPDGFVVAPDVLLERIAASAAAWFFAEVKRRRGDEPLAALRGFRITSAAGRPGRYAVRVAPAGGAAECHVAIEQVDASTVLCRVDGFDACFLHRDDTTLRIDARPPRAYAPFPREADVWGLWSDGDYDEWRVRSDVVSTRSRDDAAIAGDVIRAELPGVVVELLVRKGDVVAKGSPVAVMEAMKLFHTLRAPRDGVIKSVVAKLGATVPQGSTLFELEPQERMATTGQTPGTS